jgi:hypothetical protein
MKVQRKAVYILDDCFCATERKGRQNTSVRITRIRNTIIIDATSNSTETHAEITLTQLAWLLRNADKLDLTTIPRPLRD